MMQRLEKALEITKQNILNNNSIVAKFVYGNNSILFTGDIEEIAEKQKITKYKSIQHLYKIKMAKNKNNRC